jgi:hypothetical protein
VPTRLQQQFIDTAVEFACRGKRLVLKDIAVACGLAENRPSKWNTNPAFRDALTSALEGTHRHLAAAARTAVYNLAIAGNLAAFDRIREVERDIAGLAHPGGGAGGAIDATASLGGVHVHVHGIPERQPMSALPPVLSLPAAAQTQPTTPAK